jgi:hypothetical protein
MIRAVSRGYFAFPGSPKIHKSYGYIYGLADSIDFVLDSELDFFCYNYVETPTQSLGELVDEIERFVGTRALSLPIPLWALLPVSKLIQSIFGLRTPIHPVRVKKAATATHIVPRALAEKGFNFAFDFERSLRHWRMIAPGDFAPRPIRPSGRGRRLELRRSSPPIPSHSVITRAPHGETERKEEVVI